jgi:hypothetical protein
MRARRALAPADGFDANIGLAPAPTMVMMAVMMAMMMAMMMVMMVMMMVMMVMMMVMLIYRGKSDTSLVVVPGMSSVVRVVARSVVVVVSGMRSVGRCVIMVAVTSMVSVVPQMVRARMVVVHPAIPVHPRV